MVLPQDQRLEKRKIDELFKPEDLSHEKIKTNPVLRPLAEINRLYLNNSLLIERYLTEMDEINKTLKDMEKQNPRYKQMMLYQVLGDYKNNAAQLVHTLILQKDSLKDAIGEMLRILEIDYALKNDEFRFRKPIAVNDNEIVNEPEKIENIEPLPKEELKEGFGIVEPFPEPKII
jgi:hypothetical protein